MNMERILRIIAGVFILASVALGMLVSPKWYWFTAFVGLNLLQSGFTNWCPMISILKALDVPSGTEENKRELSEDGSSPLQTVTILNDSNFESEVLQSSVPVAVDFWASWCMPCRMLGPIIEQVAGQTGDSVKICKLNVDESPNTATKYGIQSIPAVLIFKNGQIVDRFTGVKSKAKIIEKLKKVI